jgi:hypothetical protein
MEAAIAAQLEAQAPAPAAFVNLAQWAMARNRSDLVRQLVVGTADGQEVSPADEAVLAEPYVEHGKARRQIWPHRGVVAEDYVLSDPEARDAHEWRVFFERLGVLGPVRVTSREEHAARYERLRVAAFLGVDAQAVGNSNNAGYTLVDFVFEVPLGEVDPRAIAGWLEEGYAALRGKERRRVQYHFNTRQQQAGKRLASWVELLSSLAWVPCTDGLLRCPPDTLTSFDPARDEAPIAQLSEGLAETLQEAGVDFGARIPEAPILRRLQKNASTYTPEELADAIEEAIRYVEAKPEDREQFSSVLRQIRYPNPRGDVVPFERLVQAEGPGSRSGLGGWVSPVGALPHRLRKALLDPRFPLPIPSRTTGHQALEFLKDVWKRAAADERGLAQNVGDYLPLAYGYVLDDSAGEEGLAADWDAAVSSARVFTSRRRWVGVKADPRPIFADVEESLLRRFVSADEEIATSGHLGATPYDQQLVAKALGLAPLSSVLRVIPLFGHPHPKPDWQKRFGDLLAVLAAARSGTDRPLSQMELQPVEQVIIEIKGVPKSVGSYLQGSRLYVAGEPRRFSIDAVNYIVDAYGLSQQARMAALLATLLAALDDPPLFAEALERFASEFAAGFDVSLLSSLAEAKRPAPPPGKILHGGGDVDDDEAAQKEADAVKQAAEQLLTGPTWDGGTSGGQGGGGNGSHFSKAGLTREQQTRGAKGEAELLDRLRLEEGYLGLRLLADRRAEGCGYDFLCRSVYDRGDVEVEVKTFAPDGGVHFTWLELQRARNSRSDYVLIGMVDDGGPSAGWEAIRLNDPYPRLISAVRARLDADFLISARILFTAD